MWSSLYPGQGSQSPGMGKFLFEEFALARHAFEEASDALHIDFKKLCFDGSADDLGLTENTQPCLLLVSTATDRVLRKELGLRTVAAAGHSIGEYAAVVAAGALPFAQAMRAVRLRGQAMQTAVPVGLGGMTAVMGLEPDQIRELCAWAENGSGDGPVQPANMNAPGQIVISGKKSALDWLAANYKPDMFPGRVKFIPLKVSAPFHCAMMMPAEEKMRAVLGEMPFRDAEFPIVQNFTALPTTNAAELRENLIRQVSAPVRWIECVREVIDAGASKAVEAGIGKVVSGLVKKIAPEGLQVFNLNSLEDLKVIEAQLRGA